MGLRFRALPRSEPKVLLLGFGMRSFSGVEHIMRYVLEERVGQHQHSRH